MDGITPTPNETAVKKRLADIKSAEKHFEKSFKQMLDDQAFARGKQWEGETQLYRVNMVLRQIHERTAALYAKNPKVAVSRQPKMDTITWDGEASSLQEAKQRAAENAALNYPPDPMDQALLSEAEQVFLRRKALDRVARSLLIVQNYHLDNTYPQFKDNAKRAVQTVQTCGVGYCKISFHRPGEVRPEPDAVLGDAPERAAILEGLPDDADADETQAEQNSLSASFEGDGGFVEPEGLIYTWPSPTAIIPDPKTRCLQGWQGTRWVAEKFYLTKNEIKGIYGVDLEAGEFASYSYSQIDGKPTYSENDKQIDGDHATACVYEVWDRQRGTVETVCEGYRDYLRAPAAPLRVEGFFPYRALTFNDIVDDHHIFPPSDVTLLRDMQRDINESRQGVREHRYANRPRQIVATGAFDEEEEKRLAGAGVHDVIPVKIAQGAKIADIIQSFPNVPITRELYDTSTAEVDIGRAVGSQQANIGPVTGATATEVGVAESSRQTSIGSQMDALDQFLGAVMRASGQLLLRYMSPDRAREIAGPGASWPEWDAETIVADLQLSIKSGSSGMPNQTAKAAAIERLMPFALQIGGLNTTKLAEIVGEGIAPDVDLAELIDPGTPSVIAQNALFNAGAALSAGNSAGSTADKNPAAQGSAGGSNAPRGAGRPGGPQPAMPAPMEGL
jgi:hypothetical protein